MSSHKGIISPVCKRRLQIQGYLDFTDKELYDYKFGIRFAYVLCGLLAGLGLALNNITLLIIAAAVAFAGMFPPYHPFDYLYNYSIRHLLNKPKLPPRTNQGRFACGVAVVWLVLTIILLYNDYLLAGYILGGILLIVAFLVSAMDICIPSMVFNALFRKKTR